MNEVYFNVNTFYEPSVSFGPFIDFISIFWIYSDVSCFLIIWLDCRPPDVMDFLFRKFKKWGKNSNSEHQRWGVFAHTHTSCMMLGVTCICSGRHKMYSLVNQAQCIRLRLLKTLLTLITSIILWLLLLLFFLLFTIFFSVL